MLAKLKESRINNFATLKKPTNWLTKASDQLQKLLQQKRSKSVVLQLLVVVLSQNLHAKSAPTPPAVAALQLAIFNPLLYTVT